MLLLSEHGRAKAVLFAVGWIVSLLVVTGIAVAVTDVAEEDSPAATDDGVKIFTLILGVIFLGLAVVAWRKRPAPGEPASEAKLLARVTAMSGLSVLGLGLIEAVAIVKNVPLSLGAGARIAEDTGNRSRSSGESAPAEADAGTAKAGPETATDDAVRAVHSAFDLDREGEATVYGGTGR